MEKKLLVSLIVFMLICIALWFQINFINIFAFFGATANLGIIIVVGIGLLSGKIPGALTGAAYGFLTDVLFGKSIGIYFLIYTLLGFTSGEMSRGFSKDNKLSMVYMVALFTVITELVTNFVFIILYGYDLEVVAVLKLIIKETIYNMILARLLFKPMTGLGEIINKCKNSYYLL